ncbi:MAG: hypothetical protein ABEH43_02240, partial [Flavobacteriales bacterium]
ISCLKGFFILYTGFLKYLITVELMYRDNNSSSNEESIFGPIKRPRCRRATGALMWITEEMYDKKLEEYESEQEDLLEEMKKYDEADKSFYLASKHILRLAKKAKEIFESSEPEEKRELLNFLLQNSTLKGRKPIYKVKSPFNSIIKANNRKDWRELWDDVGTVLI